MENSADRTSEGHFYQVLNVQKDATQEEIRKAYRSQSEHYHPDKHVEANESEKALMSERFQDLSSAYQVLSDEKARKVYDVCGEQALALLPMIPSTLASSPQKTAERIENYMQRRELLKMARMLNSSADFNIRISLIPLFAQYRAWRKGTWLPISIKPKGYNVTLGSAQPSEGQNVTMNARMIQLDGIPTIVLVPNDEIQAVLSNKLGIPFEPTASTTFEYIPILRDISISQSFQHPLTERTWVEFKGEATSLLSSFHRGRAGVTLIHDPNETQTNKLSVHFGNATTSCSAAHHRKVGAWSILNKGYVSFTGRSFVTGALLGLTRSLSSTTVGSLNWSVSSAHEFNNVSAAVLFRNATSQNRIQGLFGYRLLQLSWVRRFPEDPTKAIEETRLHGESDDLEVLGGKVHRTEITFEQSCSYNIFASHLAVSHDVWMKWNPTNEIGVGLISIFAPENRTGKIDLCISFRRNNHTVRLPCSILRTRDLMQTIQYGVLPWWILRAASYTIFKPILRVLKVRNAADMRKKELPNILASREKALLEQKALAGIAASKIEHEKQCGGLILLKCTFGVEEPHIKVCEDDVFSLVLDVTVPLQRYVENSQLVLVEGPKHLLPGFYDPDPYGVGEKILRIRYLFNGLVHEAVYNELEAIALPQRPHLV